MNTPTDDIKRIVSYLIDAEREHWEGHGQPPDHVYSSLAAVERWLSSPDAPAQ